MSFGHVVSAIVYGVLPLLGVLVGQFGIQLAAGKIPIPPEYTWVISPITAGLFWLGPRLAQVQSEREAEERIRVFVEREQQAIAQRDEWRALYRNTARQTEQAVTVAEQVVTR